MAKKDNDGISHGVAVLLFIGTLILLLGASQLFILPQFTQVQIADKTYNAASIANYTASLQQEVDTLQERQEEIIRPVQSALYNRYIVQKHAMPLASVWLQQLQELAGSFTANDTPVVIVQDITIEQIEAGYIATVSGTVQNVGFNTNTVLAQFTEAIGNMPQVDTVQSGRFKRVAQGDNTYVSPFTITISLAL